MINFEHTKHTLGSFKAIPSNKNYGVSIDARVMNLKTGRELKPYKATYVQYHLSKDGKKSMRTAHSLVAEAYLGHTSKGRGDNMVIDHNDQNKHNNHLSNLHIVDRGYNSRNLVRPNRKSRHSGVTMNRGRWISQITYKGKQTVLYRGDSETEASQHYWAFRDMIRRNERIQMNDKLKNLI
tara:strand:+ start:4458 stop:5000 length:543 start_codon:yes stop_codon:yes gene_type:complete